MIRSRNSTRRLVVLGGMIGLALISGCLTETREETQLRLSLHDSLARYDSVEIALVDLVDTARVLAVLHNDLVLNPGKMDPFPMPPNVREGGFQIRVRAWRFEGQLGVLMYIRKENGQMVLMRNDTLEPLLPFSRALFSIENFFGGIWTPGWPIDSSITSYSIQVALNIDSVRIYPGPVDSRAQVFIDSQLFTPSSNIYTPLLRGQETVVSVAVRNNNRERMYVLRFRHDPKAGPHMVALQTNPGNWNPAFHPDSLTYSMIVSGATANLQFLDFRPDPSIQAYVDTLLIPTDSLPPPLPLQMGPNTFNIRLADAAREQVYRFTVTRQ